MPHAPHLTVVREPPSAAESDPRPDSRDIALVATLFTLNLVPVVGEIAQVGHWTPGVVGFATAAALLTGRELWSQLRACRRAGG